MLSHAAPLPSHRLSQRRHFESQPTHFTQCRNHLNSIVCSLLSSCLVSLLLSLVIGSCNFPAMFSLNHKVSRSNIERTEPCHWFCSVVVWENRDMKFCF
ncbi:hypothetical protein SLA2020_369670 [Shorea laevis]